MTDNQRIKAVVDYLKKKRKFAINVISSKESAETIPLYPK
jgi:hypothetical protein